MAVDRAIRIEQPIRASAETAWQRVSDHEKTPTWIEQVKSVRILEPGKGERGGVGAIREVQFRPMLWTTILERITAHDPPHRFQYVLFEGMPGLLEHEGRVIVEATGATECVVRWEIDFRFRSFHPFRLFLPSFLRDFDAVLRGGLKHLKEQLET